VGEPQDAKGRQGECGGVVEIVPADGLGGDGTGAGVAAAERGVVGVEDFHPAPGLRESDAVVVAGHRCEIGDAGDAALACDRGPEKRQHAVV
jgi:hypothetical protein